MKINKKAAFKTFLVMLMLFGIMILSQLNPLILCYLVLIMFAIVIAIINYKAFSEED